MPQLTDCDKTWQYCIVPIIVLPATLSDNCSLMGKQIAVKPKLDPEQEKLKQLLKQKKADMGSSGAGINLMVATNKK
jgi:hypothetical protein